MDLLIVILLVINIVLIFKQSKKMSKAQELLDKLDGLLSEVQADETSEQEVLAQKNEEIAVLKAELDAVKQSAGMSVEEEEAVLSQIEGKIQKIQDEISPKAIQEEVTEQVVEEQTTENVDETEKPVEEVTEEQSNQ